MKDRLVLTLGEDLAEEKEWQWDGIAVLTAHLLLPQTGGESRREKRFDRYYRGLAQTFIARCEQKNFSRAAASCREAMARSAPWQKTALTLTYRVSTQTEEAIILAFAVKDGEEVLRHWEEAARSCRFSKAKCEKGDSLMRENPPLKTQENAGAACP